MFLLVVAVCILVFTTHNYMLVYGPCQNVCIYEHFLSVLASRNGFEHH